MDKPMLKHLPHCTFAFLTFILAVCPLVLSAEQASAQTAQDGLKTKITYSCVDTPIENVLMELADQAGIDIIKSPKVTGVVTVKVTGVPLEEALTNILAAHDYTFVATENMIRVIPVPEAALLTEQFVTRIYQITYADANQVATALAGFVSERGKVALNKGTSHIIVTDTESKIKAVDKFIEQIDTVTPQVLVEVRIYDVLTNEGFELDQIWNAGRNTPLKTTEQLRRDIDTDFPTSLTTTTTTTGNYRDADDGLGSFTEIETQDIIPLGTYFDEDSQTWTTRRRKPFVGGSFDRERGGALHFSILNDAVDLDFVLSVLSKQTEAKLLANPRVLVLDNETANFEIVREIPYRELQQVGRMDPITYTAFKNVGVSLKVTPHIARDEMIRLRIIPEFSVLVGQNIDGVPTIDARRTDTITMVKDGQTVAIGGLRKTETSRNISKVPLFGDLPLLGGLFRSETESEQVNELVVFITSRSIRKPELSEIEKKQLELTEVLGPEMSRIETERQMTEMMLQLLRPENK